MVRGVLDYSPTNRLPVYAILKGIRDPSCNKTGIDKDKVEKWWFIDERKKGKFLSILEEKLSNIDLSGHPDCCGWKIMTDIKIPKKAARTNKENSYYELRVI